MSKVDMPKFPKMRMDYTIPFWRKKKVQKEIDKEYAESHNKKNSNE